MHLTSFIRERTDVELERATREGVQWLSSNPWRWEDEPRDAPACLLCQLCDNRNGGDYDASRDLPHARRAEAFYMRLASDYGEGRTGALIARLARRELGRRAIEAAYAALSEVEAETERVS